MMPKIVFRGKTYYSEFEMPPNVRQAYRKEKRKERSAEENGTVAKPLTEVVDMSPEMKEIYERAVSHVEKGPYQRDLWKNCRKRKISTVNPHRTT